MVLYLKRKLKELKNRSDVPEFDTSLDDDTISDSDYSYSFYTYEYYYSYISDSYPFSESTRRNESNVSYYSDFTYDDLSYGDEETTDSFVIYKD